MQLPVARGLADAVWPAAWPAAVMAAFVYATRDRVPVSLIAVGAEMAAACAVYLTVFLAFGISREERRFYLSKTFHLLQRTPARVRMSEGA